MHLHRASMTRLNTIISSSTLSTSPSPCSYRSCGALLVCSSIQCMGRRQTGRTPCIPFLLNYVVNICLAKVNIFSSKKSGVLGESGLCKHCQVVEVYLSIHLVELAVLFSSMLPTHFVPMFLSREQLLFAHKR